MQEDELEEGELRSDDELAELANAQLSCKGNGQPRKGGPANHLVRKNRPSDQMEKEITERPTFSAEELALEKRRVTVVDQILATEGFLKFDDLFERVREVDKREEFFFKPSELRDFLASRSNAFHMTFDDVGNRSQEFREMFGFLVNFLYNKDPKNRNIDTIYEAVSKFAKIVAYEIGNSRNDLVKFVRKHPCFFGLAPDGYGVMLLSRCQTIPSAWERDALPTYKKGIRYDRSIELTGIGQVVSAVANTRYVKVEITNGRWKKQTVYAISKNICNEENIAVKYPVGSVVKVSAFRAYEAAQPWTAFKMRAEFADDEDDIWTIHGKATTKKRTPSNSASSGTSNEAAKSTTAEGFTNGTSPIRPSEVEFFTKVVRDEEGKQREVDACLGNGPLTLKEMFDVLVDGDFFCLYSHMVNFVCVRTHLYRVTEGTGAVLKAPNDFRTEMFKFLCYVDEKSKERVTLNQLRKLIKSGDGGFVDAFVEVSDSAESFGLFLREHLSLVELKEVAGEEYLELRGTLVPKRGIFIPHIHFPTGIVSLQDSNSPVAAKVDK